MPATPSWSTDPSMPESSVTEDLVKGWVRDFDLDVQTLPDHEDGQFAWAFAVRGQPFATVIARRRADFDYLAIQATVAITSDHLEALRGLSPGEREAFLYDLRLSLNDRNIGHQVEFSTETPDEPLRVTIGVNLVDEQVTRAAWFERNHVVQSGASIVALLFQKMAHKRCWP